MAAAGAESRSEYANFAPLLRSERLTMTLLSLDTESDREYLKQFAAWRAEARADTALITIDDLWKRWDSFVLHPSLCGSLKPPGPGMYLIRSGRDDPIGPIIGMVTLNQRREDMVPDIGYLVSEEYHGKGYATEAIKEVLKYWRLDFGIPGIALFTDDSNRPSIKLAERLGFVRQKHMMKSSEGDEFVVYLTPGTDPLPEVALVPM